METIFVFSHLRWDSVYQRPQHLLSRFAEHYRILFFEEPKYHEGPAELKVHSPLANLTVCQPHTPVAEYGFVPSQLPYLRKMVRDLGAQHQNPIVWFYTPMAMPLLDDLNAQCIIYDCMDELSAFKNPPPRILEYEDQLLKLADVVFTGGPSLCQAKTGRNPNVHCFSSSVEVEHFRQALDRNIVHPDISGLPSPRLGFYGVIDERFDAGLVGQLAQARPDWQIVLVGPVVKIDPASLPRRENIHYLGQQPYSALPQFLAGWDACLMPFALNESTRFISPTKSLEYMAAELPIISTPIKDVVDSHGDVVEIANGASEFIAACDRVLAMSDKERQAKIRLMRKKLAQTSWNATAAKMRSLIEEVRVEDTEAADAWLATSQAAQAASRLAYRSE